MVKAAKRQIAFTLHMKAFVRLKPVLTFPIDFHRALGSRSEAIALGSAANYR